MQISLFPHEVDRQTPNPTQINSRRRALLRNPPEISNPNAPDSPRNPESLSFRYTSGMAKPRSCPSPCNVLLIGGGGREHALAWKLKQSPRLGTLWLSDTANAGLAKLGSPCPVVMSVKNAFHAQRWCDANNIHLVVIGPEQPLADGLADSLQSKSRAVFGPNKAAALLEADKSFAKQVMRQAAIPTAEAKNFADVEAARAHVLARPEDPCVIKATGLAAGKGAVVC